LRVYSEEGYFTTSDARHKEDVRALPYGLDEVRALRPVAFRWIGDPDEGLHYGLIAQEVREVLPEVVSAGEGADGALTLNYGELVPVLVRAVQEQQDEIEAQAQQIAALEARLGRLEQGSGTGAGLLRAPGIAGLGGLLVGVLAVGSVRRRRQ
ncbi:MAG: tail fiber domain-containing protein, partial [Anaerolineae bacterium]|nr:tail fiber domain-containing protein [Anaerolineae bacterium]